MTQTDTMTDIRSFFAPKPKPEPEPEPETTIRTNSRGNPCMYCLRKTGGTMKVGVSYGTCKECSEAWKQADENPGEPPPGTEFTFETTLWNLMESDKVMGAHEEGGFRHWTREPTEEEWKGVVYSGQTLRLPYNWGWDNPMVSRVQEFTIPAKEWDAGCRWTLLRWVHTMRVFYSKNKKRNLRSLGDHTFVESIGSDGLVWMGS
jgi:hypothetical protein